MRGEHEIWLLRANHVPLGPTQPVCGMIYFPVSILSDKYKLCMHMVAKSGSVL